MRPLDLIPRRWLEYEPPSTCHDFGIGEAALASTLLATTAEAGTAVATTALPAAAVEAATAAGAGSTLAAALPSLGTIGTVAGIGGTLLTAKAQMDQSAYQAAIARNDADALKIKGNDDAAAAERAQITQLRRTQLMQSAVQAQGAASGTDASSPDILNTQGQIAGQGQYNALSALYEGQARQRADTYQSSIDLFRAGQLDRAMPYQVGGTVLSGLGSFADRRIRLRAFTSGDTPFFGSGT